MSPAMEQLLKDAMTLSETERVQLAGKLLESVEDPLSEAEWSADWNAEIARRLAAADSGQMKAMPWDEAEKIIFDDRDATTHD